MYTLSKETEMTVDIIKDIKQHLDELKKKDILLNSYYIGKHKVLEREKNDILMNNKLVINHAKYITDINVAYLLGNPITYSSKEDIEALQGAYKKQAISDLDVEIAKTVSISGRCFEYIYFDEESNIKSVKIDNKNGLIVYDDTIENNKLYGIMFRMIENDYKDKQKYEVIVVDSEQIKQYFFDGNKISLIDKSDHYLGVVPMIEYKNNHELQGDFEQVISLIDAYNVLQSARINDKEQLVEAILIMYNVDLTSEQLEMLKSSRGILVDSKVEYLIKSLDESNADILRKNLENDIYKISMTPNMCDENFIGSASGVAIKYRLLAFEQSLQNKERYFEKGLRERFEVYNKFFSLKSLMKEMEKEAVDIVFSRNLPSNDLETPQLINNLVSIIDKEALISHLLKMILNC